MLFLCTGNSARSLLAEAYLNARGGDRCGAFSAGSFPTGTPNPYALQTLQKAGIETGYLRSKSWDVFAGPQAPSMDIIITVCDNAAGEVCPVWPGHPTSAHWPFPDPAAFAGDEAETLACFAGIFAHIRSRIDQLLALPEVVLNGTDRLSALRDIGQG